MIVCLLSHSADTNTDITGDSDSDSEADENVLDYESDSDAEDIEAGSHVDTFLLHVYVL